MGAQGTAQVDFGAWPGKCCATVAVTGQAAIGTSSAAEAWIRPQAATAEHSVDEHVIEPLKIVARDIVAGTGFTIEVEALNGNVYGRYDLNWVWN